MVKFIDRLSLFFGYVSGWIVFVLMLLVTAAVAARRLFGYPLVFGDEYSAYLMVACVFLGGAYTLKEEAHIRVDVLAIRFKPKWRMFFQGVTSVLTCLYALTLTWQTTRLVLYYKQMGQTASSVMETPTWIPAMAVPVGMAVLALQSAMCVFTEFKAFYEDKS